MPITLNHSNISVQYSSDKSYIIETVKSDLYRRNENYDNIIRDNLQTAPVTPSIYIENGTNNVYAVESYTYSGSANTADFTRVFPKNTTCDILMVGGGGAGGANRAGGGGSGALILSIGNILNGTYTIKVGNGGSGYSANFNGVNGYDSEIVNSSSTTIFRAKGGGGGGGIGGPDGTIANNGGSGGGARSQNGGLGGTAVSTNIVNGITTGPVITTTYGVYGNIGGRNITPYTNTQDDMDGAGGGGVGQGGSSSGSLVSVDSQFVVNNGGKGGDGLYFATINGVIYNFKNDFNVNGIQDGTTGNFFIGGGGGGGDNAGGIAGLGGKGGGGAGGENGLVGNQATGYGSGGGGGGGSSGTIAGGTGSPGIVIIRYLLGTIPANNLLTNEPVVVAPTFTETTRTFAHSGGAETQTTHTITVGRDTICDILVVGGGGGGGYFGGGGGGGAILFANNLLLNVGNYIIKVGKGGTGASNDTANGTNGIDSSILINAIEYISKGGGGGGTRQSGASGYPGRNGNDGGSGGGGSHSSQNTLQALGGSSNKNTYTGWLSYGNNGGKGRLGTGSSEPSHSSGGGGGAGSAGGDTSVSTGGGNGGSGLNLSSTFGSSVGHSGWFGGGGGGQTNAGAGNPGYGNGGNGLLGGGGNGGFDGGTELAAQDGLPNTGGGGGGAKWDGGTAEDNNGGHGGSGIVIIKFKSTTPILEGITHKRLNFVYTPNYPFIQADNTNLKAWYKFDEMGNGEGYLDSNPSSTKHNLIKPSGSTPIFSSMQNISETSASEQGTTAHLQFPTSLTNQLYTINNTNGITFSFWYIMNTNSGTWASLIEFSQNSAESASNNRIGFSRTGDTALMNIYMRADGVNAGTDLTTNTIDGKWHHLTFSISSSGVWTIYSDGVNQNISINKKIANSTFNFSYIFKTSYNNDASLTYGNVDDFRIYNNVLSATEIEVLYNIKSATNYDIYTLNFPVPTLADINNNTNIVLRGAYDIALSTSNSVIIPKEGQYIPKPTFINYSVERMYPPVRNFTAATTTVSGQTNGNGIYIVSNSSTYPGEEPFNCFNSSFTTGGSWGSGRYTTAGVFNSTSFIVAGYLGDWLKIQLPVAIKLTRFGFLQRTNIPQRAPKDFRIYGSNDNITWVELVNKTDAVYNASYMYEQTTTEISNTYTYYGLVVNKIFVGVSNDMLNFDEWYIYGQEQLNSQLSLRYHLLNPILDPIGAQWTYSSNNTNVYHMGSVGIGTTTPEYPLDVRGTIYSSTGGYTSSTLTKWSVLSDRRIKENIVKASYDKCLENVKNIELYNFNFKDNCVNTNDRHQLGFIAQEVQQVYPKAVEVSNMIMNLEQKIDDLLTLNITQIDYTLYGAVKSLIEKIENIKIKMEHIKTTYDIP